MMPALLITKSRCRPSASTLSAYAATLAWSERSISPTVTFWPVPDSNGPYTFDYFSVTQIQDANLAGGETPDLPYRWLDALVAGLSHRLARIYAPALEDKRKVDALRSLDWAAFAYCYNGPQYAKNQYDTKMAKLYAQLKAAA